MSIEKTAPLSGITALSQHEERQPQSTKVKKLATNNDEKDPIVTLSLSRSTETLLQSNDKDIREQKVEQIRQKIERGELMFNAEKIADILIELNTNKRD